MGSVDKKLARYPHLVDRIYKKFKFETYDKQDIKLILSELSEMNFGMFMKFLILLKKQENY